MPDWVEGELGETVGSSLFRHSDGLGNPAATSTWVSNAGSSLRGVRQRFNAVFYSPRSFSYRQGQFVYALHAGCTALSLDFPSLFNTCNLACSVKESRKFVIQYLVYSLK